MNASLIELTSFQGLIAYRRRRGLRDRLQYEFGCDFYVCFRQYMQIRIHGIVQFQAILLCFGNVAIKGAVAIPFAKSSTGLKLSAVVECVGWS